MALSDAKRCTATAKSTGQRCRQPAVQGYNVCRLHGAGNIHKGKRGGRPAKHGRYSVKHRQAVAEKYQRFLEDQRPGDLFDELAILRALLADYLERSALLSQREVEHTLTLIDAIGKLVERISRILNETALTAAEVQYLQAVLADLITRYVDEEKREAFLAELRSAVESRRLPSGAHRR